MTPVSLSSAAPDPKAIVPSEAARQVSVCPSCESRQLHYDFSFSGHRVVECNGCGLMMLNPQPSEAELAKIHAADDYAGDPSDSGRERHAQMRRATARDHLRDLQKYRGIAGGRLLEIGCGRGDFLFEAHRCGYEATGIEINPAAVAQARAVLPVDVEVIRGTLAEAALGQRRFDVCVLSECIEQVRDPVAFLRSLRQVLAPGAVLLVTTPSLDSWTARTLRQSWVEFRLERLHYFDSLTIQNVLLRTGFDSIIVRPDRKIMTLDYVARRLRQIRVPMLSSAVILASKLVPAALCRRQFRAPASGIAVFARLASIPERRLLSVVIPAFNEASTVALMLEQVLAKKLAGMDIELIVVESNSTDGTRDVVQRYRDHPRVRIVLEDRPRGKGHAVRAGLAIARGDFVLIQDADLEYDLEDYDALVEPLMAHQVAFVLGARHGGKAWKMRQFEGRWAMSKFMNVGHWFFTFLVNVLFSLRLRDPFTMYKVFRRDCLYGLSFHCNRFDFDYELLTKLVRKGYRPIEIPVNYRSRGFAQGKKVLLIRDPLNWLAALVRLRLERIDPLQTIAESRR